MYNNKCYIIIHFYQCLSVLHDYLNDLRKLFSDPYLTKFLNASTKPFFPYMI